MNSQSENTWNHNDKNYTCVTHYGCLCFPPRSSSNVSLTEVHQGLPVRHAWQISDDTLCEQKPFTEHSYKVLLPPFSLPGDYERLMMSVTAKSYDANRH